MTGVRWGARAALTLGVAASLTANILAAEPTIIGRAIAAWPPVAFLITVGLLERVPTVAGRPPRVLARIGGTAVIAAIAALLSYRHMTHLAAAHGETGLGAAVLPLSVDGIILVASMVLIELRAQPVAMVLPTVSTVPAGGEAAGAGVVTAAPVTHPPITGPTTPEPASSVVAKPEVQTVTPRSGRTGRTLAPGKVAAIEQAMADGHTTIPAIAAAAGVSQRSVSTYRALYPPRPATIVDGIDTTEVPV